MRRVDSYFTFVYFLCVFYVVSPYTIATGGRRKYSNVASTEQKLLEPLTGGVWPWIADSEFIKNPPQPYHFFPMFQHVPGPLLDMGLFKPVSGKRHFPRTLSSLLLPPLPERVHVSPVSNARGVEVWCGYSKISVRVRKNLLGFTGSSSAFQLGTCPVSRSDKTFLYFHYNLNDCDGSLTTMNGQIIYSNVLSFTPDLQGVVIRAVPLTLDIQCLYNRFHYSYKMGYVPVVRERIFQRTLESKVKFSLFVCNERWERVEGSRSFLLGEPVYFEATAVHASKQEEIFVDSCHATVSKDPSSTPQHHVIANYGCMEDSRREGSQSRFLQRRHNSVRFSVDAFLLPQVIGENFYLHCTMSVHGSTSSRAKSCSYNGADGSWEELDSDSSICACCDSKCDNEAADSVPSVQQTVITSKPWILGKGEQSLIDMEGLIDSQELKFKSAPVSHKKHEDGFSVEIVTDGEQIATKEGNKQLDMKDLDEDVEVIVARRVTTSTDDDQSGKVFVGDQQVSKINEDSVRHKSLKMPDDELLDVINGTLEENDQISREQLSENKMEPEHFKTSPAETTMPSQLMNEDIYLNVQQEPAEWKEDKH